MPAQQQPQEGQQKTLSASKDQTSSSMQQPPSAQFYAHSNTQRTLSDNFGTAKAGPPSPDKMNLLPYSHSNDSSTTSQTQAASSSSTTTAGRHSLNAGLSQSMGGGVASAPAHKHKSRHNTVNGNANGNTNSSQQYQHPQPQKPPALQAHLAKSNGSTSQQQRQQQQQQQHLQAYHEPVAPSSGRSANSKGSSTTSEFTKRKNWSQRIVEEMQDVLHVLSPSGTVLFVSPSVTDLTGHTPEDMVGRHITDFMDPQDCDHFLEEFKQSIMTETALTTYFRVKRRPGTSTFPGNASTTTSTNLSVLKEEDEDDNNGMATTGDVIMSSSSVDDILLEVTGQPYYTTSPDGVKTKEGTSARKNPSMRSMRDSKMEDSDESSEADDSADDKLVDDTDSKSLQASTSRSNPLGPKTCKCFFAMARPYPSRSNATLDTFLELKIENEKLRTKLADIYREIEGESEDTAGMGMTMADNGSGFQLRDASGRPLQNQQPQAYFHGDPRAIDTLQKQGERQISGFPSRMSNVFAQQHAQASMSASQPPGQQQQQQQQQQQSQSVQQQTQQYFDAEGQSYGYAQQGQQQQEGQYDHAQQQQQQQQALGGASSPTLPGALRIDTGEGLVSSAGLIHSSSNTYGALGIGISAGASLRPHAAPASAGAAGAQNGIGGDDGANAEDKKKKQKKQKTEEGEFVCRDCGTVDSPEWRRGPLGPKTLCNACGLRWAKKNKQQQRNSLGGNENIIMTK